MSWLATQLSWLADYQAEHVSVPVTYTRGSYSVTFGAVPGLPQELRATLGTGARVRVDMEWVDFHFKPSLLVLNSVQVEPARGDRLTIGTISREVSPPSGSPAWGRSGMADELLVIHTLRR